jgi:hypothetical protein
MILCLADPSYMPVIDLSRAAIEGQLPAMQDCGTPLCVSSDIDKAVVCYDTNKIAVFDLLNLQLHKWTKQHLANMPRNFLDRYNRMIGIL